MLVTSLENQEELCRHGIVLISDNIKMYVKELGWGGYGLDSSGSG
jgi:hypothetical protein